MAIKSKISEIPKDDFINETDSFEKNNMTTIECDTNISVDTIHPNLHENNEIEENETKENEDDPYNTDISSEKIYSSWVEFFEIAQIIKQ
jgi:hypothetical protein